MPRAGHLKTRALRAGGEGDHNDGSTEGERQHGTVRQIWHRDLWQVPSGTRDGLMWLESTVWVEKMHRVEECVESKAEVEVRSNHGMCVRYLRGAGGPQGWSGAGTIQGLYILTGAVPQVQSRKMVSAAEGPGGEQGAGWSGLGTLASEASSGGQQTWQASLGWRATGWAPNHVAKRDGGQRGSWTVSVGVQGKGGGQGCVRGPRGEGMEAGQVREGGRAESAGLG